MSSTKGETAMLTTRWVRLALCVFLLPIALTVSLPGVAVAADTELLVIDIMEPGGNQNGATCHLPLAMQPVTGGAALVVGSTGYCKGPMDASPGWCSAYESGCTTAEIAVYDEAGECASAPWEVTSSSGTLNVTVRFGSAFIPLADCDPVEICLTVDTDSTMYADLHAVGCSLTALDSPVVAETPACAAAASGPFPAPSVSEVYVTPEGSKWQGHKKYVGVAPSSPSQLMSWKFYYFVTPGPAQGNSTRVSQGGGVIAMGHTDYSRPAGSSGAFELHTTSTLYNTQAEADAWVNTQATLGYGLYGIVGTATNLSTFRFQIPTTHLTPDSFQTGLLGISDPAQCAYYWGTKIADLTGPTDTRDEPLGDVITPDFPEVPPPVVPEPDPEDDDGFGWLAALLGELMRAIGSLVTAILGLAGDLIDGFTDLLQFLWIPDPDAWGLDEITEQFMNKPPFSLLEPLAEEATQIGDSITGAGDCGSLADFSGGGIPIHIDCSDVRNAPGMDALYQLVKVGFLALTGLYIFRMFSELLQEGQ